MTVKPKKHKHSKNCNTKPSMKEPVLSRKLSRKLKIQEDILARAPIITAYGRHRFCIENYRSILEYTEEFIRIQTKTGKICFTGKHMVIAYYRDDCMCILGDIVTISYE